MDRRRLTREVNRQLREYHGYEEDPKERTITFDWEDEEGELHSITLHAHYEVCDLCEGSGSVVDPSVDERGLSREDFEEDPDFREDYFSGRYDIQCPDCEGLRVVLVAGEDENKKEDFEKYQELLDDVHESVRETFHEREMGY